MASDSGYALGIDLGGTKIYSVITDRDHHVLAFAKHSTDAAADAETTADVMYETAMDALSSANLALSDLSAFGAAVPSPVDPATGDCFHATNMGWKSASMKTLLAERFGHPFSIGNDANLGLLAEHTCGAAKNFDSAIGYFIGTGLGGAILLNGQIIEGKFGLAGELGHAVIRAGGRRCGCGRRGCAEAYCSKIAFVKALQKEVFKRGGKTSIPTDKFNENSRNIKSKYLARAYQAGEPAVRKVIDKGLRMLGVAAASACAVVSPECIVLGGGFTQSMGELLLPPFLSSFRSHLFGIAPEKITIRLSELGDSAVAVGAAVAAGQMMKKEN